MADDTPPITPPAEPRAPQAEWKGRVSTSLVSIPYVALVIFWIGFFIMASSWAGLTWLAVMWMACLVLLPMSIVGGIIAAVLCLPGFILSFYILIGLVGGWA